MPSKHAPRAAAWSDRGLSSSCEQAAVSSRYCTLVLLTPATKPTIQTVGLLSPGEMGHAVGQVLRQGGLRVITCLRERSPRTAALAARAGIEVVADDLALVRESDVVLSIVPPSQARTVAQRVAAAAQTDGTGVLFADCNAIAPRTVAEIGAVLTAASVHFVDGGIIGPPPRANRTGTRLYLSGPEAEALTPLARPGLEVCVVGPDVGQASGLKMCYAALTKGLTALATELLVAAKAMGLTERLREEFQLSQALLYAWIEQQVPTMPPKAARWVGEMAEIAGTFGALGLTPRMLEGAADVYRMVERTPLSTEVPESRQRGETLEDAIRILAAALAPLEAGGGSRNQRADG